MKDLTRRTVAIVRDGDAVAACELAIRHHGQPEALMLFNTRGLSSEQKHRMSDCINGADPAIHARLGALGFCFPVWRFLAQGRAGAALLERFGMQRLSRPTDLRDAGLADPDRDEFGTGFLWHGYGTTIEYRRAYLLCATAEATLVIRNNSYFFGRDRLADPVYARFGAVPSEVLAALTRTEIETDFLRWVAVSPDRVDIIGGLVARLDAFENSLQDWLCGEGLPELQAFLRDRLAAGKGMPWLGHIAASMPPWFPENLRGLSDAAIDAIDGRVVLLSGPNGDLPAI